MDVERSVLGVQVAREHLGDQTLAQHDRSSRLHKAREDFELDGGEIKLPAVDRQAARRSIEDDFSDRIHALTPAGEQEKFELEKRSDSFSPVENLLHSCNLVRQALVIAAPGVIVC